MSDDHEVLFALKMALEHDERHQAMALRTWLPRIEQWYKAAVGPASDSPDVATLQSELAQAKHDLAREMTLLGQERELNVNLQEELDRVRKGAFTHAYCDNCEAVQEAEQHSFVMPSVNGKTLGGDITCKVCHWIIATVGIKTIPSTDLTTLGERG